MTAEVLETALNTVRHYLGRTRALVEIASEADLAGLRARGIDEEAGL